MKTKHTALLIALALIITFVSFWVVGVRKAEAPASHSHDSHSHESAAPPTAEDFCKDTTETVITYDGSKFSPGCTTIAPGTSITWINKSDRQIQIGADAHPAHNGNREVSNGEFILSVPAGGQATSVLTTRGEHVYHDHLNASHGGQITVK